MKGKRRTSLSLDAENFHRLKDVASRVPGATMSSVVDMSLEMYLPHLEAMAAAAEKVSPGEKEEAMLEAWVRSLLHTARKEEEELE